jgi:ribosomal protein S18 acetylase RimI-like enzyme
MAADGPADFYDAHLHGGLNPAFDPALLLRIEDAGLNASAPPQQRWMDGWLLRLSPGKAKRARCINAVADGRLPLDDKLAWAQAAYSAARLPLLVRITPFSRPNTLDAELATRGLERLDDTRVMVSAHYPAPEPVSLPLRCRVESAGHQAFAQQVGELRGSPLAQRHAHAERLALSPVPFQALVIVRDSQVLACGQWAIENELVGLYDVFTAPAARGRGLAQALCRLMLAEARQLGARHAYLQVDAANLPARAAYHRLGFVDGYAYHYRGSAEQDDPLIASR